MTQQILTIVNLGMIMKSKFYTHSLNTLAATSFALVLAGCSGGGGGDNGGGDNGGGTGSGPGADAIIDVQVDATSYTETVYIDLETGQTVSITDEQAADSDAWDIGIKRYDIITNGGVSGTGNVGVAINKTPAGFYNDEGEVVAATFIAATDAAYEADLVEAVADDLTYAADYTVSGIKTPNGDALPGGLLDYGWYTYNLTTHRLAANTANNWQLRSAEGTSYAQMKATDIEFTGTAYNYEFTFAVQAVGTDAFVAGAAVWTTDGGDGEVCFDFDSNSEQACDSAVWDVKLVTANRSVALYTNSGVSGSGDAAAFGPITDAVAALYVSGTEDALGNQIAAQQYVGDKNYSGFNDASASIGSAVFEYGVDSAPQYAHALLSNYRVFAVDTDTSDEAAPKYKVQVTDYYNDAGTSGHVSLRILANQ